MKRHLTLSTASHHALDRGDGAETVTHLSAAGEVRGSLSETGHARPRLALTSVPVWKHKLILTGKLDHRSVAELEEEIECLCEEGVTTLALDLRQLDAIDSSGITAIARRGAVCKMRGHEFAVIPGSHVISGALAEAGATDLLAANPNVSVARGRDTHSVADESTLYRSTAMIKSL